METFGPFLFALLILVPLRPLGHGSPVVGSHGGIGDQAASSGCSLPPWSFYDSRTA